MINVVQYSTQNNISMSSSFMSMSIQQWGWVTSSDHLSYDPSPTIYTYIRTSFEQFK